MGPTSLLLLTGLAGPCPQEALEPRLEYLVDVTDEARIEVRLTLARLREPLVLELRDGAFLTDVGQQPLFAEPPRTHDEGGNELWFERAPADHTWRLVPGPSGSAVLRWSVATASRRVTWTYLEREHGLLGTASLLLVPPADFPAEEIAVRVRVPEGGSHHAPWPKGADGAYLPSDVTALGEERVVLGSWDLHRRALGTTRLLVAFAPGQEAPQARSVDAAASVVAYLSEVFGASSPERYFVLFASPGLRFALHPEVPHRNEHASTTLIAHPGSVDAHRVEPIVAAGLTRAWFAGGPRLPAALRFLETGLAEYHRRTVPWRLGVVDDRTFLHRLGRDLAERSGTNRASTDLATLLALDLTVRQRGGGRGVVELVRTFLAKHPRGERAAPSLSDFLAHVELHVGEDLRAELERFVRQVDAPDVGGLLSSLGHRPNRIGPGPSSYELPWTLLDALR